MDYYYTAESAMLIFLQSRFEKLVGRLGIEPPTLDLSSLVSGAIDHLAVATPSEQATLFYIFM